MKKLLLGAVSLFSIFVIQGQGRQFRFAFLSDTHIGSPNGGAEEDLRRTVRDINAMDDVAFVVVTGDITELGTDEEIRLAKHLLDSLDIPYFVIPGNHDSGWSESGGESVITIFGYDKFVMDYGGIRFIGCASGPYVRMSDGHVPRNAINWIDSILDTTSKDQPLIFLNHYPLDNGLDNWYEITDRLRNYNTIMALCGHGHANRTFNAEEIPSVMGRSNLRARAAVGGYNLVDVRKDSIVFYERTPFASMRKWTAVTNERRNYDDKKIFPRPDYNENKNYNVREIWKHSSEANVISTPVVAGKVVVFGNHAGSVKGLSLKNGKTKWTFSVGQGVFSSPAYSENKIVFGSADQFIYCLDTKGKLKWKYKADAAVLGSPIIENKIVYIGASDGKFRAIDLISGKLIWSFDSLKGPVMSTPVIWGNHIIFGAWDRNLYSLNKNNGTLNWSWNNGSPVINFSPASCIPVIYDGVVYVVAPDRYISAIDVLTGKTLWRNNDARVRESIGISADGQYVYGKTMQDTIVAYKTSRSLQHVAWKMHAGFGYEHVPSMLMEESNKVFFGTKNGVVYAINPFDKKVEWKYKIDNSMVNTVRHHGKKQLVAATMDGKVVLLQYH